MSCKGQLWAAERRLRCVAVHHIWHCLLACAGVACAGWACREACAGRRAPPHRRSHACRPFSHGCRQLSALGLEGTIAWDALSRLSTLTTVHLDYNKLEGPVGPQLPPALQYLRLQVS